MEKKKQDFTLEEVEDLLFGKRGNWEREAYEQEKRDEIDRELQKEELKKRMKPDNGL